MSTHSGNVIMMKGKVLLCTPASATLNAVSRSPRHTGKLHDGDDGGGDGVGGSSVM